MTEDSFMCFPFILRILYHLSVQIFIFYYKGFFFCQFFKLFFSWPRLKNVVFTFVNEKPLSSLQCLNQTHTYDLSNEVDNNITNHVLSSPPPLAPPRCPEEYGVGGIGKAMAAGVIYCRLGKDKDLLDVLKVDDKCLAKGPDPKEGYEELSESLVRYAGGHAWSLKRLRSFLNGKSKDQWHETLEKLVRLDYPGEYLISISGHIKNDEAPISIAIG
ncbi:uncharacterized protein LOC115689550 [Syzygium oleosum]|uniref:uncharacterized protein LOC115689550 n=1 Tax=Syzygium oleosum TaxID=219896 RepID=UPI0024B8D251|nr:uncharacterized protein LOC115689550 [Syzygium oleosum]